MSKHKTANKWQQSAIERRPRRTRTEWVPHAQLYAEIEAGYQYFMQARMKAAVLGR